MSEDVKEVELYREDFLRSYPISSFVRRGVVLKNPVLTSAEHYPQGKPVMGYEVFELTFLNQRCRMLAGPHASVLTDAISMRADFHEYNSGYACTACINLPTRMVYVE